MAVFIKERVNRASLFLRVKRVFSSKPTVTAKCTSFFVSDGRSHAAIRTTPSFGVNGFFRKIKKNLSYL
jgi:hypothetical protein